MNQIEMNMANVKSGALGRLTANKWWLAACATCFVAGLVA